MQLANVHIKGRRDAWRLSWSGLKRIKKSKKFQAKLHTMVCPGCWALLHEDFRYQGKNRKTILNIFEFLEKMMLHSRDRDQTVTTCS